MAAPTTGVDALTGDNRVLRSGDLTLPQARYAAIANNAIWRVGNVASKDQLFTNGVYMCFVEGYGYDFFYILSGAVGSLVASSNTAASLFSNTATTASKVNIYVTGGYLEIENKTGGALTAVRVIRLA
mgnify:CR=1 FL=1